MLALFGYMLFNQIPQITSQIIEASNRQARPYLVSVCGGSSLGKTSVFVPKLVNTLSSYKATTVIHQDQFRNVQLSADQLDPLFQGDHPQVYQISRTYQQLKLLLAGQRIALPGWHYEVDPISQKRKIISDIINVNPNPIVVLEGFYALYPPLHLLADFSIYLEAPAWTRLLRRIIRNWKERKYANPADIGYYFLNAVLPAHKAFVISQKKWAKWHLHSTYTFDQSIQKFNLIRLSSPYREIDPIYSLQLTHNTHWCITPIDDKQFYFELYHQAEPYIAFHMSESFKNAFITEDWYAY